MKRIIQFFLWAAILVSPFVLKAQKQDSVRLLDPKDFPSDTTVDDMDETYGRPFGANKKYKMKYVRKYVRAGFSGAVTVNTITGEVSLNSNSVAWATLNSAVKDSIRYAQKDTTIKVLSALYTVNTSLSNTKKFKDVYFAAKGNADTAKVSFTALPLYDQLMTVFHVKADSGKVAIDLGGFQGPANKRYTILYPGQRAIITPLYDAQTDAIQWHLVVVMDKGFNDLAQNTGVLYVAKWGNDSQIGAGGVYRPYLTIEAAVAAASSGNVIYVFSGTYTPATNLWKNGVNFFFEDCKVGVTYTASEGFISAEIFRTVANGETMKIRGNLRAYQLVKIQHKNIVFDAEGALLGQTFFAPGANHCSVTIKAHETPGATYQFHNTADTVTRNTFSMIADIWVPWAEGSTGHAPISYFNNTSTRSKLNNYSVSIGSVHMTSWADFYSNRGVIQCRGVGMAFDSTFYRLDIGKGVFDLLGVNVANFGILAFFPFQGSTGNQLFLNCDDCLLSNRATLANGNVMPENTEFRVTGNWRSFNRVDPFFVSGGNATTNRFLFNGDFYCHDTTLFILNQRANWEFEGNLKTREADDQIITANWANSTSRPLLKNVVFDSPASTPMTSNTATTWYTANARSLTSFTRDADINYIGLPKYDPDELVNQGLFSGSTDASGDVTITLTNTMPDATYIVICQQEGTSDHYGTTVHTKGTGSFKVRFYNNSHIALGAGVTVNLSYGVKDY